MNERIGIGAGRERRSYTAVHNVVGGSDRDYLCRCDGDLDGLPQLGELKGLVHRGPRLHAFGLRLGLSAQDLSRKSEL